MASKMTIIFAVIEELQIISNVTLKYDCYISGNPEGLELQKYCFHGYSLRPKTNSVNFKI